MKKVMPWLIPLTCLLLVSMAEAAPGKPSTLVLDGGAGRITASWDAVADADSYQVLWRMAT